MAVQLIYTFCINYFFNEYIIFGRMHKEYLEEIHRGKKKNVHWLLREHNNSFADWFLEKVSIFIVSFVPNLFSL